MNKFISIFLIVTFIFGNNNFIKAGICHSRPKIFPKATVKNIIKAMPETTIKSIPMLPDEMWIEILKNITAENPIKLNMLYNLFNVNISFRRVLEICPINIDASNSKLDDEHLKLLTNRFKNIKRLDLTNTEVTIEGLINFLPASLTGLDYYKNHAKITGENLILLMDKCPELIYLNLSGCTISFVKPFTLKKYPNLKCLTLSKCRYYLFDERIKNEVLCQNTLWSNYLTFFSEIYPNLTTLCITKCNYNESLLLELLEHLPNLENLYLSYGEDLCFPLNNAASTEAFIKLVNELYHLKLLVLEGEWNDAFSPIFSALKISEKFEALFINVSFFNSLERRSG